MNKTKTTFDDELMLNVQKLERDYTVLADICYNQYGMLVMGLGKSYVAQIEVPARQYTETEIENPDYDPEDETSQRYIVIVEPVPFDMKNVTLRLWAVD